MLEGLKALVNSEKALVGGFLSLGATALTLFGRMTIDQWISFNEVLFVGYISGKTLQGGAAVVANALAKKGSTS